MLYMPTPMHDARLVLWLRWRELAGMATYWLRAGFGYDPRKRSSSERLYLFYLVLIGAAWVPSAWLSIAAVAGGVGHALGPQRRALILTALPALIFLLQIGVMIVALRSSPLKLTFPDTAYVAGSPLSRAVVVLVGFARVAVVRLLVAALVLVLVGVALTGATEAGSATQVALRAIGAALPLALFVWSLAWLAGVARLAYRPLRLPFVWLAPLLLLVLLIFASPVVLWPGRVAVAALRGQATATANIAALCALAVLLVLALGWVGDRANLTVAADESILYARIQALGTLAWRNRDLVRQMKARAAFTPRRRSLRLVRLAGAWAPLARVLLTYLRRPSAALGLLWDIGLIVAACYILTGRSYGRYTMLAAFTQPWLAWLLVALIRPPRRLVQAFSADVDEPFLRQFLPVDNLRLLLADAAIPGVALGVVDVIVLLAAHAAFATTLLALAFVPALTLLMALCQGMSLVRVTVARVRVPYVWATGIAFGLVLLVGVPGHAPLTALTLAVIFCLLLGQLVAASA